MQTQTNDYGVAIQGDGAGIDIKDTGGSGANFRLESDGGDLELHSGYGGSSTKMDSLNYRYVEMRIRKDAAASDTWGENGEGLAVFYVPSGVYYTITDITLAVDDDFGGTQIMLLLVSIIRVPMVAELLKSPAKHSRLQMLSLILTPRRWGQSATQTYRRAKYWPSKKQ